MPVEPETLTEADVADIAAAPKPRAKPERKPDSACDAARNWLASTGRTEVPVQELLREAYGGDIDALRIKGALQMFKRDPRFDVETRGIHIVISLCEIDAAAAEAERDAAIAAQQMAAEEQAEREATAQAAEALPEAEPAASTGPGVPVDVARAEVAAGGRTIGEAVLNAAAEAGERERAAQAVAEQEHEDADKIRAHMVRIRGAKTRLVELELEHDRCKRIATQAKANVDEQQEFLRALIDTDPLSDEPRAGQQTLDDAGVPTDGSAAADEKGKAWGLDRIGMRVANSDWFGMEAAGLTVEQLAAAALSQTASTGKPYKVRPVELAPVLDGDEVAPYALTAVQHAGKVPVAVLIRLHPIGAWPWETKPLDVPSQDRPEALAKLGRWCGIPARIGRKRFALGSDADALLVALPQEADARLQQALSGPAADDAADGDDSDAE